MKNGGIYLGVRIGERLIGKILIFNKNIQCNHFFPPQMFPFTPHPSPFMFILMVVLLQVTVSYPVVYTQHTQLQVMDDTSEDYFSLSATSVSQISSVNNSSNSTNSSSSTNSASSGSTKSSSRAAMSIAALSSTSNSGDSSSYPANNATTLMYIKKLDSLYRALEERVRRLEQALLSHSGVANCDTMSPLLHSANPSAVASVASVSVSATSASQKKISKTDLEDYCLPLLQRRASPTIGELNSLAMAMKTDKYHHLETRVILSKVSTGKSFHTYRCRLENGLEGNVNT